MQLNHTLLQIKSFLFGSSNKQKQIDSISNLLRKLKFKEQKLITWIETEKDEKKRRDIKRDLKVIRAQQKKGKRLMEDF